jgi:hypothetical protein
MIKNNVRYATQIGCDIETSKKAIELAKKYDQYFATIGYHPTDGQSLSRDKIPEIMDELEAMLIEISSLSVKQDLIIIILIQKLQTNRKKLREFSFLRKQRLPSSMNFPSSSTHEMLVGIHSDISKNQELKKQSYIVSRKIIHLLRSL